MVCDMTSVFNTTGNRYTIGGKAVLPLEFADVDEIDPKAAKLIAEGSLVVQEVEEPEVLVPTGAPIPDKTDSKTKPETGS